MEISTEVMAKTESKYGIAPYKAADMTKQATKIIEGLLKGSTSFTRPYEEARTVLEIAEMVLDKFIEIQEGK